MRAALVILVVILIAGGIVLAGCMRQVERCNYDSICTPDETDNCADCRNVLGRDVQQNQVPMDANAGNNVP